MTQDEMRQPPMMQPMIQTRSYQYEPSKEENGDFEGDDPKGDMHDNEVW
jgi:hypothetical protein